MLSQHFSFFVLTCLSLILMRLPAARTGDRTTDRSLFKGCQWSLPRVGFELATFQQHFNEAGHKRYNRRRVAVWSRKCQNLRGLASPAVPFSGYRAVSFLYTLLLLSHPLMIRRRNKQEVRHDHNLFFPLRLIMANQMYRHCEQLPRTFWFFLSGLI